MENFFVFYRFVFVPHPKMSRLPKDKVPDKKIFFIFYIRIDNFNIFRSKRSIETILFFKRFFKLIGIFDRISFFV